MNVEREFEQRQAERFERDVMSVMLAAASGAEVTLVAPGQEGAQRVFDEAARRIEKMQRAAGT